jgi:GNAT superfamily N-acetyltransferase
MEFTVRRATVEDSAAIARVHVESWKSTYTGIVPDACLASLDIKARTEMWDQQLSAGKSAIFISESDVGVIGFVAGGCLREPINSYDGELYAIYMTIENQGRGIGRALVRAVANTLREEGYQSLVVWVLEKNPAVSFYKTLGGIQIAQQQIEICGISLEELAFGWPSLYSLLDHSPISRESP